MANNNSRIVPDTVQKTQFEIASTPVNKLETFRPDLSEAQRTKAIYESLASFGKGMLDISQAYKRQASEHMLAFYKKTEEKNRGDWAEVSKNVTGMAKFNPYNKDAYNQIQSAEILRQGLMELESIPELEKKSPDEFNSLLNLNQKNLISKLQEAGIKEKNYSDYLIDYDNKINAMKHRYTEKNAEYQYELYKNKVAADGGHQYWQGVRDNSGDKVGALTAVTNYLVEGMNATGTPSDTQAAVLMQAVKTAISIEPGKFKSSDIILAFSDYKINGKSMKELIPDFDSTLQKMVRDAKMADLNDQKIEYETKQFNQQLQRDNAMNEFLEVMTSGKQLSPKEQQQWAIDAVERYGLDGVNGIKLFSDLASGRKTFTDLKDIPSDPEILVKLGAGVASGTTSMTNIADAMNNGTLGFDDGLKLMQNIQVAEQKQKTANDKRIVEHIKRAASEYIEGTKDVKPLLKDMTARTYFMEELNSLRGQYEQGSIDYQTFNNELYNLKQDSIKAEKRIRQTKNFKSHLPIIKRIASGVNISDKQWNQVDNQKSAVAFKRLGMIHNNSGIKDNSIYIASAPQKQRSVRLSDGSLVNRSHKGYDLGGKNVQMGRAVYAPMSGQVVGVYTGQNGGAGNMVIVRCDNGKFIKYMHLQSAGLPQLGSKFDESIAIGRIGNSGAVANKSTGSLHVEFYDSEGNWIPAHRFM